MVPPPERNAVAVIRTKVSDVEAVGETPTLHALEEPIRGGVDAAEMAKDWLKNELGLRIPDKKI